MAKYRACAAMGMTHKAPKGRCYCRNSLCAAANCRHSCRSRYKNCLIWCYFLMLQLFLALKKILYFRKIMYIIILFVIIFIIYDFFQLLSLKPLFFKKYPLIFLWESALPMTSNDPDFRHKTQLYSVCYGVRGRALASHTDVRGFEPQCGGRLSSLTCWQL